MKHFITGKMFKVIKLGLFIAVIILILLKVQTICTDKDSPTKYADFFQHPEQYDVLYVGSSHVRYDFFPMELWNQYGITSYNFGNNGCFLPVSYWVMENALDHANPKLVIIDTYFLDEKYKCESTEQKNGSVTANEGRLHLAFDCFPFSKTKVRALDDLIPDDEQAKKNGFYNKLSEYHNRWDTGLIKNDFFPVNPGEKGASYEYLTVADPVGYTPISDDDMLKDNPVGAEYLKKMILDCQRRGIRVLLTYLPFEAEAHYQEEANTTADIAKKYGVDYIDFLKTNSGINYETDLSDTKPYNGHLNPSGARKLTAYLGQYISTGYQLTDHRSDAAYSNWGADYDKYSAMKLKTLDKQTDINCTLMLLNDPGIDCCVYVKGESAMLKNQKVLYLLQNLTGDSSFTVKNAEKGLILSVHHDGQNTAYESDNSGIHDFEEKTTAGELKFKYQPENDVSLTIGDSNNYLDSMQDDAQEHGLCVLYWDNRKNEDIHELELK